MEPDRWQRVTAIFEQALEREGDDRLAFVKDACAGDAELQREVEVMLSSHDEAGRFLSASPATPSAEASSKTPALTLGTRLGPYQVTAKIGEGGMGEVYRARDTKLDRDVALKVLPSAFTDDPERLARFEREAKLLASLNHPNIAGIFGLEEADGVRGLALELVEGPTLADRIAQGPIPVDEAVPIAIQIAEALEAAHEQGIVHRDLKPANIKLRSDGTVKVLDFGLAKEFDGTPKGDPNQSPTLTAATQEGVILGTAAYMAPEQARGRPVDKRADIWAFGCVLYEMLVGQRPFVGRDVSETLGAVLRLEPDWDLLPDSLAAPLRLFMQRCLEKETRRRVRDVGDVRLVLEASPGHLEPRGAIGRRSRPWALAGAVVIGAMISGLAAWNLKPRPAQEIVRFSLGLDPGEVLHLAQLSPDIAISPDGLMIAFLTKSGWGPVDRLSGERLKIRVLDEMGSRTLAAEGELNSPFFSADGSSLGFYDRSDGRSVLKRVSVRGGPVSVICELPGDLRGASWTGDGTIVFATYGSSSGLWRVSAEGGDPELLTTPSSDTVERDHLWPEVLPDGDTVLFNVCVHPRCEEPQVASYSLSTQEVNTVFAGGSNPKYSPTGHLVYAAGEGIWAVRFDPDRLETSGDPLPVVANALSKVWDGGYFRGGAANVGFSSTGTLAYTSANSRGEMAMPVRVDRSGRAEPLLDEPLRSARYPRLSPSGDRLALSIQDPNRRGVWVYDLTGRPPTRLSFGGDNSALWTPDGRSLVFERANVDELLLVSADGGSQAEVLLGGGYRRPLAFTPDGSQLIYADLAGRNNPPDEQDIMRLSMSDPEVAHEVLRTPDREGHWGTALSPDGRWLAYVSDVTGEEEVWVRPYPDGDTPVRVSANGGIEPVWSRDGRELFYVEDGALMAISVEAASTFGFRPAVRLFQLPSTLPHPQPPTYDVAPDGSFVTLRRDGEDVTADRVHVVLNWHEELNRLLPPE